SSLSYQRAQYIFYINPDKLAVFVRVLINHQIADYSSLSYIRVEHIAYINPEKVTGLFRV
ncbi:MAG TPA: hypothetical protein PKC91_06185, partial [Ignavibacteria bacterium]|nr:hypothetical protein [Ignavibacteria bacterium]